MLEAEFMKDVGDAFTDINKARSIYCSEMSEIDVKRYQAMITGGIFDLYGDNEDLYNVNESLNYLICSKSLYLYTLQGPIFKVINLVLRKQCYEDYPSLFSLCNLISCGTVNFNDVNGDTKLPDHHIVNNNLILYRGVPLDPKEID